MPECVNELKKIGNDNASCEISKKSIVLKSKDDPNKKIPIIAQQKGPVIIGSLSYTNQKTNITWHFVNTSNTSIFDENKFRR